MRLRRMMAAMMATGLAASVGLAQEGRNAGRPRSTRNQRRQELRDIQQKLGPLTQQVLQQNEDLRQIERDVRRARQEAGREYMKLQRKAEEQLAKAQPDLADTIQLIHERDKKAQELMQVRGEGRDQAREELGKLQRETSALRATIRTQLDKCMQESEDLRPALQEWQDISDAAREMERDFNAKVEAKLVEISPEAKELLERRKVLMQPRAAIDPEARKKLAELRKRARELDQKLRPARFKVANDPDVQEVMAQVQEVTYSKMAEAAPELADAIAERKRIAALEARRRELDRQLMPVRQKVMFNAEVREAWAKANEVTYDRIAENVPEFAETVAEYKKIQEEIRTLFQPRARP